MQKTKLDSNGWLDKLQADFWFLLAYIITEPEPTHFEHFDVGTQFDFDDFDDSLSDADYHHGFHDGFDSGTDFADDHHHSPYFDFDDWSDHHHH